MNYHHTCSGGRCQLCAAIAEIATLTKERDELQRQATQRQFRVDEQNVIKDERIAALVSVIQDADSWMSLLWHRGKPDDLSVRLKIEKTLGDLRRISNGENISKVINGTTERDKDAHIEVLEAACRLALPHFQGVHSDVSAALKKALNITVKDRLKCTVCGRIVDVTDGVFDYHDDAPPCRSVCPNSKHAVLAGGKEKR